MCLDILKPKLCADGDASGILLIENQRFDSFFKGLRNHYEIQQMAFSQQKNLWILHPGIADLSGPVLRDTARLSQRYPPIACYGFFGVSTWPIGCDTPLPLF